MNIEKIRRRITHFIIQKETSESRMSLELGKSSSYIRSITSGRALPSLRGLLEIIEYFELSPQQFFDESDDHPQLSLQITEEIKSLGTDEANAILLLIKKLQDKDKNKK